MTELTEKDKAFLKTYDASDYDRPSVAVDIVIFTLHEDKLKVLLIRRGAAPFEGLWALPGGFLIKDKDKTLDDAAARELLEETGTKAPYLEQLYTFGSHDRDPRDWTLSVTYFALIPYESVKLKAGSDASDAKFWSVHNASVKTRLAFDHSTIIKTAVERLRAKLEYTPIAGHLLGKEFTLPELQKAYELILDEQLDKTFFRRGLAQRNIVEETGNVLTGLRKRPAKYYRFTREGKTSLFFPRSLARANR